MNEKQLEQKLRMADKKIIQLEQLISKQLAQTTTPNELNLCKIKSVNDGKFTVQKRNVGDLEEEQFLQVNSLSGSPSVGDNVMVGIDANGKRCILPQSTGTVAVRETGSGGEHVDIDVDGTITVNPSSETLPIVFAEPASNFHGNLRTNKVGRIYKGVKLSNAEGVRYYLCFIEAFGEEAKTFSDTISISAGGTLEIEIGVDGQGNVTSLNLSEVL